ncbi:unnamed protein product [Clonostachys rhizophaga]|uniref:Uncharacterized protein n=1 Tax=Clonostachys rhizophaga TaxID=160324 RepID=A0A9N9VGF3_9HYPO|nr:unnamed protein product [Clonostachys rhizophaga]
MSKRVVGWADSTEQSLVRCAGAELSGDGGMDAMGWSRGAMRTRLPASALLTLHGDAAARPWPVASSSAGRNLRETKRLQNRPAKQTSVRLPPSNTTLHRPRSARTARLRSVRLRLSLLHGEAVDIAILSVGLVGCGTEVPYSAVHSLAHCLIHLACAILLRLQPSLVSMYSDWPPLAVVENATDRHPCEHCCRQEGDAALIGGMRSPASSLLACLLLSALPQASPPS